MNRYVRHTASSLIFTSLVLWGCPTGENGTTPTSDAIDNGLNESVPDAGSLGEPARSDAGPEADSVVDGGNTPVDSEPTTVACGIPGGGELNVRVADDAAKPTVTPPSPQDALPWEIGAATRQQVGEFFLQAPRGDENLPYRWHCDDLAVTFDFVDVVDGSGMLNGEADGGDVLARVVLLASSPVAFLGTPINELTVQAIQEGLSDASDSTSPLSFGVHTFPGIAQMVVYPELGFSFLAAHDDSQPDVDSVDPQAALISLTFFTPQQQDLWGSSIDLTAPSLTLNGQTVSTSRGLTGGSDFSSVTQVLGSDFDVRGAIEGDDFKLNVITYSALGLRFAEGCGENPLPIGDPYICSGKITAVVISSPFMGVDAETGLRLGSSRAEVESEFGTGSLRVDEDTGGEVFVYGSSDPLLGIIYATDAEGTDRVGAFILNFIDES